MGTKGWLLAGLVALCMTTSGCKDKNLEEDSYFEGVQGK